jgi:hypothetical protein
MDRGNGQLVATKVEHTPAPPPARRSLVTRTFEGKRPGVSMGRLVRIVDPLVCERRVLQFEELEGRTTRMVSHFVGFAGPRCDILSFNSVTDLEAFTSPTPSGVRDLSLVARFIEVKGRSSENLPISLKGNELNAATAFGDKYYLYRLFMEGSNRYVLLVMQNPLQHPEAVETVKDIYMSRASLDRYDLTVVEE